MLTTVLLFLILALLVWLVILQLGLFGSGAAGGIEQLAREIRRELAGLRSDNLQNFHRLKGDIEDLFDDRMREESGLLEQGLERARLSAIESRPSVQNAKRAVMQGSPAIRDMLESEAERAEAVLKEPGSTLLKRQLVLFSDDSGLCEAGCPEPVSPEPVEYLSVPAADFDPDSDPPYDPDEIAGQGEGR